MCKEVKSSAATREGGHAGGFLKNRTGVKWALMLLLLPAACRDHPSANQEEQEKVKQMAERPKGLHPNDDLNKVDWATDTSGYIIENPDILAIPPAWEFNANGKTYSLRYYTEHHPGDDHVIPIITVGREVVTIEQFWQVMKMRQQIITDEGSREGRILREFYNADELRNDTSLDDRIKYKREAIKELEDEMSLLSRKIDAERKFPSEESEKKIAFWGNQLSIKGSEFRLRREELAVLEYRRYLREQLLQAHVRGPEVTPKVEPRVRGVESHTFEKTPEPVTPEEKKPAPEDKKPEEAPKDNPK
jgi:hypothetical protein